MIYNTFGNKASAIPKPITGTKIGKLLLSQASKHVYETQFSMHFFAFKLK